MQKYTITYMDDACGILFEEEVEASSVWMALAHCIDDAPSRALPIAQVSVMLTLPTVTEDSDGNQV